jgi:hypothetical protein
LEAGGKKGRGGLAPLRNTALSKVLLSGGNANPGPPSKGDGGDGGGIDIAGANPSYEHEFGAYVQSLLTSDAGNGGAGANRCPPGDQGGNGGKNGELKAGTLSFAKRIFVAKGPGEIRGSFNGGDGHDGNPPGLGWHPKEPEAAFGLRVTSSFMPGADGQGCTVSFSGRVPGVNSWNPAAISTDSAEPTQEFALGTSPSGQAVLADWNLQTNALNSSFGTGGLITLPAAPTTNGYNQLTRLGVNDTLVYAVTGMNNIGWWRLSDSGIVLGSGTVDAGNSALYFTPMRNINTPSGPIVVWFGIDPNTHVGDAGSFAVTSSTVTAGPLPTTTFSGGFVPVTVDLNGGRLGFVGLTNTLTDAATLFTDLNGGNVTGPYTLYQNAGQTEPTILGAGSGHWFVFGGLPATMNDQQLGLFQYGEGTTQIPGFSPWYGPHAIQAFPVAMFADGAKLAAFGNDGGTPVFGYFNSATGAPDSSVKPFPFPFLSPGLQFAYIQSVTKFQGGYLALLNDSAGAGIVELSG